MSESEDFIPTGVDDPRIRLAVINKIRLGDLSDQAIENLVAICWKHNVGILKGIEIAIQEATDKDARKN